MNPGDTILPTQSTTLAPVVGRPSAMSSISESQIKRSATFGTTLPSLSCIKTVPPLRRIVDDILYPVGNLEIQLPSILLRYQHDVSYGSHGVAFHPLYDVLHSLCDDGPSSETYAIEARSTYHSLKSFPSGRTIVRWPLPTDYLSLPL